MRNVVAVAGRKGKSLPDPPSSVSLPLPPLDDVDSCAAVYGVVAVACVNDVVAGGSIDRIVAVCPPLMISPEVCR